MPYKDPEKRKQKNAEYFKKWYENNKEKQYSRIKLQQQKTRDEVRQYKESNPCKDCGKYYPYCVMDFDHLGDKKDIVSVLANKGSRKQVWEEIEKCDLVCSNCHRIRTHNRR
jgi:hypothetical protein